MRDLRQAWRSVRSTPLLSTIVIVSLAIGIGANTVVFSWLQIVRWRPLPGVSGVSAFYTIESLTDEGVSVDSSWLDFRDLQRQLTSVEWLEAFRMVPLTVGAAPDVSRAAGLLVSGGYFRALGLKAAAGRLLDEDDAAVPGEQPVVVISYDYWHSHFGGSTTVVGRPLRVNDVVFTIVGVTPRRFQGTTLGLAFDLWIPATMAPVVITGSREIDDRGQRGYVVFGRLRTTTSQVVAQQDLDRAMHDLAVAYPRTNRTIGAELTPFTNPPRGPLRMVNSALVFLQGLMLLVLVAVCSNVASLVVAKVTARQREFGIRLALGASRTRAARLVLAEAGLLALGGTVGGVLLALWGVATLQVGQLAIAIPVRFQTDVDAWGLTAAAIAGALATLLIAGAPIWFLLRLQPQHLVRQGGREARRGTGRQTLMGLQVALASLVLATAALFVGRFHETRDIDPGFKADGVLLAAYDLTGRGMDANRNRTFAIRALDAVRAMPGVTAAALATSVPLDIHGLPSRSFTIDGRTRADGGTDRSLANVVSDGYLATMGITLLRGRDVSSLDDGASAEAIVNQAFVDRYLSGEAVLGRRLQSGGVIYTIVGVAATTVSDAFGEPPTPLVLYAFAARPGPSAEIHLKTTPGVELGMSSTLQRVFRELDPTVPLFNIRTLDQHIATNLVLRRIPAQMFLVLGPLLLFLAAVGVFAVVDYNVSRRASEVGIRLALGARPAQIVRMIVADTMGVVLLGVAAAMAIVVMIDLHAVRGGVRDLPALVGTPLAILAVASIASWLPARRAGLVAPSTVMRRDE
ncbi:MAG TPA: ABC transporter permease [Vicinamibacterales bacterium]|nr:ABC transporter permease [Vicinamibacterales bacterium]